MERLEGNMMILTVIFIYYFREILIANSQKLRRRYLYGRTT